MVVLSWSWGLLILVKRLPDILSEGVGRKRAIFGACEWWIVRAWSWEFLLERLGVIHESVPLCEGRGVLRSLIFVLGVDLVMARGWKLGYFLSDEIVDSLPA